MPNTYTCICYCFSPMSVLAFFKPDFLCCIFLCFRDNKGVSTLLLLTSCPNVVPPGIAAVVYNTNMTVTFMFFYFTIIP